MRKALPIILIRLAAEKTTAPRDVIRAATVLVNMTSVAEAAVANEIRLSEIVSLASEVEALQKRVDGDE
jgi:purine nucleoside phosphorylase